MSATVPSITVTFREQADSAVSRSARGILCIVIAETGQTEDYKVYNFSSVAEVNASGLTSANKTLIGRAFTGTSPAKVTVVAHKAAVLSSSTVGAALDDVSFNWVCSNSSANQAVLAAYVAAQTTRNIKACVVNVTSSSEHVMNLADQTVTLKAGGTAAMLAYVPRIAAICAACPITSSITYTALDDVSGISGTIGDNKTGIYKDDNAYRISKGVMANGEKMAIVEAKDIIDDDIVTTAKNNYIGQMRNSPNNQACFCADIYGYLKSLAEQGVINAEQDISVEVDTDAIRSAWAADASHPIDMTGWTDAQIRAKPYGSYLFIKATCSILDCIEDISFTISLG